MGFTANLKFDRASGSTELTLSAVDAKIEEGQVVTSAIDGAIASGTTVASIAGNRLTLSQGTGVALAAESQLTFTSATGMLASLTAQKTSPRPLRRGSSHQPSAAAAYTRAHCYSSLTFVAPIHIHSSDFTCKREHGGVMTKCPV